MVELETRTPVGCAQQGLHSTGQIHEHVAHEEEPGAEGPVRLLPTQSSTIIFCRCPTTHCSPPSRKTLPVHTMVPPLWASTQQARNKSHPHCPWPYTTKVAIAHTIAAICKTTLASAGPRAVCPQHNYLAFCACPVCLSLTLCSNRKKQ